MPSAIIIREAYENVINGKRSPLVVFIKLKIKFIFTDFAITTK